MPEAETKPEKILYPDQEDVYNQATKYLLSIIKDQPSVKKAIIWASLAEKKFGVYKEKYRGLEGSDIDLVVVVDENHPLPEPWHWTKVSKSWFDLYTDIGTFEYQGHKHRIDGLLVFPSRHSLEKMEQNLKDRSERIFG